MRSVQGKEGKLKSILGMGLIGLERKMLLLII
jgi:hypothetical protein